jgi:plastocyanin
MPPDEPREQTPQNVVPPPASTGNRSIAMASLIIMIAFVIVVSLVAFHSTKKTSPIRHSTAVAPAKLAPAIVDITGTSFMPATISVKVGQAVEWTNTDNTNHGIASDNTVPAFKSKQILSNNDSFSYVFNKAGTYPYHDTFNTKLAGIVIVK